MITILRKRQVVALMLIILVIVAGYFQYTYKKQGIADNERDSGKLGEAVYVELDNNDLTQQPANEVSQQNNLAQDEAVTASKEAEDYFAQTKLDKEISRSRDADEFMKIVEDENASAEIKEEAYNKMMALIDLSDKEMRIEALIKKQGFKDVIVLFADDGSVDVVVKAPNLTEAQVAQISDIVSRQANVSVDKIVVKNKF